MTRLLAIVLVVLAAAAPVRADSAGDAVALLPLEAEPRLAIYGQAVASEIARALVAGEVAVVVVGPRMAMPERAGLIVDGTIARGKADAVILTVRVRNRVDGTVLATISSTAASLPTIDQAAAAVAARVLPAVRERLAIFRVPVSGSDSGLEATPSARLPPSPPPVSSGLPARPRPMLLAISGSRAGDPFHAALTAAVASWARAHDREPIPIERDALSRPRASATVRDRGHDLAIAFELEGFSIHTERGVPLARARVRVRISGPDRVVFDRVVVTDSVVGDRGMAADELAARTAREVLDILRPHLRRKIGAWT